MITIENATEQISEYFTGFKKFSDQMSDNVNPMFMMFNDKYEHPVAIVHLPAFKDDTADKMLKHKLGTTIAPFFDIETVSLATDVFFTKVDKDDVEDVENLQYERPSQAIDRSEGITLITMKDTGKGLFSMKEYGRDDTGKIYFKEQTSQPIDMNDEETLHSWVPPMLMSCFRDQEVIDELVENKDEELKLMMTGLVALQELGYLLQVSEFGIKHITEKYTGIVSDELMNMFLDGWSDMKDIMGEEE